MVVAIIGVGMTRFGRDLEHQLPELAFKAVDEALRDAGVSREDIGFIAFGNVGGWSGEFFPLPIVCEYAGLNPRGGMRVEAACASGSAALAAACMAGYRLGLASNNSRRCVEMILARLGIRDFLDAIISRDDVVRMKPHEEIIVKAIKHLNTLPWRTVYVGDSAVDVIAGRRARAYVIGITGGADPRERLIKNGADFIIDELDELLEVLEVIRERAL
jgi:hypothetical protein